MFKMNTNSILALFDCQMLVEHGYIDVVNTMTTLCGYGYFALDTCVIFLVTGMLLDQHQQQFYQTISVKIKP